MTFTAPFTAVPGEIITAAGWNTSARDNINHIWGVIGGNPGTSGLVPHSTGATAGAWGKVTDDLLYDQKVSQSETYLPDLDTQVLGGLFYSVPPSTNAPVSGYWHILNMSYPDPTYRGQIAMLLTGANDLFMRTIVGGTPTPWLRIWTSGSDGISSGLDADVLRGYIPGNASGNLALNNGVLNTNLIAALASNSYGLSGYAAGNGTGNIPISNGVQNTNLSATYLAGVPAGNGTGNIPISNGVVNAGLVAASASNATTVAGLTVGNASGNVPISNGVQNTNLSATYLAGVPAGNGAGNIPINNGVVNTGLVAASASNATTVAGLTVGNASGNVPVSNGVINTNLNAASLNGIASTGFARALGVGTVVNSAQLGLTTSYQVIPGCTISSWPGGAGTYLVIAHAMGTLAATDGASTVSAFFNGAAVGPVPALGLAETGHHSVGICTAVTVTNTATDILTLRATKASGSGGSTVDIADLTAIRIA